MIEQHHIRIHRLFINITYLAKKNNIPIKWKTFEHFLKDNWIRYYRAFIKWRAYKRVVPGRVKDLSAPLKIIPVYFTIKIKERGYTKENTVFTSPSDSKKYSSYTHKYMFEDKLLGTRDIKNILKKRGIVISIEKLVTRIHKGTDIFRPNDHNIVKWKGKYRSFKEIAKLEKVPYQSLKKLYKKINDLKKAVDKARTVKPLKLYDFEGQRLLQMEICRILAKRTNLKVDTIRMRFQDWGFDIEKLTAPLGKHFK